MSLPALHSELVDIVMTFVPSTAIQVCKKYTYLEKEMIHEPHIRSKLLDNYVGLLQHAWDTRNLKLFRMILNAEFLTIPNQDFLQLELNITSLGRIEFVRAFCESKYLKRVTMLSFFFRDACAVQDFEIIDLALKYEHKPTLIYIDSMKLFQYLYNRVSIDTEMYLRLLSHYARNNSKILRFLLDDTEKLQFVETGDMIFDACESGNFDSVIEMLKYPMFDPSVYDNSPIRTAFVLNHHDIVRVLLADPRVTPQKTMLPTALERGYYDFALELLADGRFDINENIGSVRWAIKDGRTDIVDIYRERVNETNREILESLIKEYTQYIQ